VLVAVSGGADSTALAILLASAKVGPLALAHVRHGFRPAAAGEELARASTLSRRLGVPLHRIELVPPAGFRAGAKVPEAWAREQRYARLVALARELGLPVIATGHHARDRRETQLLQLLRGGGLRALAGMSERRRLASGTWLWRPLLDVEPEELRALLREQSIDWVEDASNADLRLARNRVRHRLLPELARIGDPLLQRADELARLAQRALARTERACEALLPPAKDEASAAREAGPLRLPLATVRALPPILRRELLECAARRLLATPLRARAPELRSVGDWLATSTRGGRRSIGALGLRRSGRWLELGTNAEE
jgi:tRNA(Ile)-lysidine synthase